MKYNTNIIFLDIDGCLTSIQHNTYFNPNQDKYHPEQDIIRKIIQLCEETNAKVIISSNWRKFDINGIWKNAQGEYHNPISEVITLLGKYCIGMLPSIKHINKAQTLILWFEENICNKNFVIFDDDLKEELNITNDYGICKHFIHVNNNFGITNSDIQIAKKLLKLKV